MEKTTIIKDTYTALKLKYSRMPFKTFKYLATKGEIDLNGYKEYIYENDDKIVSAFCYIRFTFSQTAFFGKITKKGGMSYDKKTKKFNLWQGSKITENKFLFANLMTYLHKDWFLKMGDYPKYCNIPIFSLVTKTLASQIINGKVNNPEEFIKAYASISLKAKKIPWTLIRDFLNTQGFRYRMSLSLRNVLSYSTNPISALNAILAVEDYNNKIISRWGQLVDCAIILDEKINFSWSYKRAEKELTRMCNELDEIEITTKKVTPIQYEGELPLLDGMKMINTELELFTMTKYVNCHIIDWESLQKKDMFLIKYEHDNIHCLITICSPVSTRWRSMQTNQYEESPYVNSIIYYDNNTVNTNSNTEVEGIIGEWLTDCRVKSFFSIQGINNTGILATVMADNRFELPF